jgi:hypothetical protein
LALGDFHQTLINTTKNQAVDDTADTKALLKTNTQFTKHHLTSPNPDFDF